MHRASWPKPWKGIWQWSTQHARAFCGKSWAWRGFKNWRSLATCTKSRRESAKWTSPALPGRDSGPPDGQVPRSAVLLQLFGQILRQAWFWADLEGHWQFVFCVIMWFVERSSAPGVAGVPKMEKKNGLLGPNGLNTNPGCLSSSLRSLAWLPCAASVITERTKKARWKRHQKRCKNDETNCTKTSTTKHSKGT